MSSHAEALARLRDVMAAVGNSTNTSAAAAAAAAAMAASSSTAINNTTSSEANNSDDDDAKQSAQKNQEEPEDDEEDITYTPYKPAKLSYGKPHPDKVVENSTLAAVAPPDITYNMVMPASIIAEGKLSNLQLEAIVYGCQRHAMDLPKPKIVTTENEPPKDVKMTDAAAAVAAAAVKSEMTKKKNKGLQVKNKHEDRPQADSPALSPCPPSGDGTNSETPVARKKDAPSYRAGFLLGDVSTHCLG